MLEVKTSRADVAHEIGLFVGIQHLIDTGRLPERTPPAAKADDLYTANPACHASSATEFMWGGFQPATDR